MVASAVNNLKTALSTGVIMTASSAEDIVYMRMALDEARSAAESGEVPIGAILVKHDSVLSRGRNQRESWQDPTAHAEMIALRAAAVELQTWRLLQSTLYVTMEPCVMCIGAAILGRVKRVVFGVHDPKAGACGSIFNIPLDRRLNHHVEVVGGILQEESRQLLQEFFSSLRKRPVQTG
jgi:tRNA(adenine34) deaminase